MKTLNTEMAPAMNLTAAVHSIETKAWALVRKLAAEGYDTTVDQWRDMVALGRFGQDLLDLNKARLIMEENATRDHKVKP